MHSDRGMILVTGATGYIGGRLAPRLLEGGWNVRCLVRDPDRLDGRSWTGQAEIVRGDVLRPESLTAALRGVRFAYYLVHGMVGGPDFHERDLAAAKNFGAAARAAGVEEILYLGGLGDPDAGLAMAEAIGFRRKTTIGGDKGYDTKEFGEGAARCDRRPHDAPPRLRDQPKEEETNRRDLRLAQDDGTNHEPK